MVGLTRFANKMNGRPADQLMVRSLVLRSVGIHSLNMENGGLKGELIAYVMSVEQSFSYSADILW